MLYHGNPNVYLRWKNQPFIEMNCVPDSYWKSNHRLLHLSGGLVSFIWECNPKLFLFTWLGTEGWMTEMVSSVFIAQGSLWNTETLMWVAGWQSVNSPPNHAASHCLRVIPCSHPASAWPGWHSVIPTVTPNSAGNRLFTQWVSKGFIYFKFRTYGILHDSG